MPRSVQPDRWLFCVTVGLCLIGAVMVFSASAVMARETYGNGYTFLLRQMAFLAAGFCGLFALMNMDYRKLREPAVVFSSLAVVLLLLIAVFFVDKSHATHRWIRVGPLGIQPSELAKLAVILYLAWFLEMRGKASAAAVAEVPQRKLGPRRALRTKRGPSGVNDLMGTLLPAMGPVLLFVGLIVLQPDLGTSVHILLIALVMLFVAGLSPMYVLGAAAAAVPVRKSVV